MCRMHLHKTTTSSVEISTRHVYKLGYLTQPSWWHRRDRQTELARNLSRAICP